MVCTVVLFLVCLVVYKAGVIPKYDDKNENLESGKQSFRVLGDHCRVSYFSSNGEITRGCF